MSTGARTALEQQDGLHNVVTTPEFQAALYGAIERKFAPLTDPELVELLRRYLAPAYRNDSRSYAVGIEPPAAAGVAGRVRIAERDPQRRRLIVINNAQPTAQAQTDVDSSATGAAGAIAATLPAAAGATTYITGFEITGAGATAGSVIAVTVTGILGGTKTYYVVVPTGAGVSITPLVVEFARPIPASAVNQAIAVNVPSFGAGNTNAAVTAHGFQQTPAAAGPTVYVGGRQVTVGGGNDPSGGIPIPAGSAALILEQDCGELFAVANAVGVDVRVLELMDGL